MRIRSVSGRRFPVGYLQDGGLRSCGGPVVRRLKPNKSEEGVIKIVEVLNGLKLKTGKMTLHLRVVFSVRLNTKTGI